MRFWSIIFLLGLSACGSQSHLAYKPSDEPVFTARRGPVIAAVFAVDRRKERPTQLATIMGGYGNPLKTLDTVDPVKDEVARVFREALQTRGLYSPGVPAPDNLVLTIESFDADQLLQSQANIRLELALVDRATNQVIYRDHVEDQRTTFGPFDNGIYASIDKLQHLAESVLGESVDRALDKPAFLAMVNR